MPAKVDLPRLTCHYEDCGHTWVPRSEEPSKCPRCQRPLPDTSSCAAARHDRHNGD